MTFAYDASDEGMSRRPLGRVAFSLMDDGLGHGAVKEAWSD